MRTLEHVLIFFLFGEKIRDRVFRKKIKTFTKILTPNLGDVTDFLTLPRRYRIRVERARIRIEHRSVSRRSPPLAPGHELVGAGRLAV
jgi:hypothetical protein